MEEHVSVLLNEAIDALNIKKDGIYVDLTLGRGGHSSKILEKLTTGKLYCFDQDKEAIEQSRPRLEKISSNFEIIKSNFRNFKEELEKRGISKVDGILMDLGVSSPQFDNEERGFSYKGSARLDMRMDQEQSLDAYEVINNYSLNELCRIFREYGEDKYYYQIARKIVQNRIDSPIETTDELVDIIKSCKPQKELMKKGHPAKQIFQAIRIEVNDELGALKEALQKAIDMIDKNGRIVVISFHSLEDRIVKNMFNSVAKVQGDRLNLYTLPDEIEKPKYELVNNKIIVPSEKEMEVNSRSKSAKMRILTRTRL
ncbi:MAG: 16S rRNA (cytosine(1402)-N(4))-methyltransferase RsmH [Bacillales bacterium]|nr:16S rRNA (cytosine(1402)-N(4))-methyltransferase RsmH [Bacillales bacterium]